MPVQKNDKPTLQKIRQFKYIMIIGYTAIVVAAIIFVSVLSVKKTDQVLKSTVSSLVSSLNVQMKLNMDSYLERMETTATLAFALEETYTYDATDPSNDEYEAISTEKLISDKLYSLCIMENFVDYGIIYRNNHKVGKISNGTTSLFGDQIFDELEGMISRQRTKDGWAAGYQDNFKRIYYVKRIHENALMIISFYTAELESVFDNPETMSAMEIRLTNQNYDILYSSEQDEVGQALPADIVARVQNQSGATVMDNSYLVTVNSCGDDWYVICSVPTQIILNQKNEMQFYIYVAAFVAALLAALVAGLFSFRMTQPVEGIVENLDTKAHVDQLTGLLNKRSFEETAGNVLTDAGDAGQYALILLDVDNFKEVNDTLGHGYGDSVLAKIGGILRANFSSEDLLGRIGGDEFCVLLSSAPPEGQRYEAFIRSKCEALCEEFRNNYTGDDGRFKISTSIGVAIFRRDGDRFEELYFYADKALYASKNRGKDTYTFAQEVAK